MEKEKQNEFIKELQQLCEKHNLRHCAFTGIDDESYIGIRCLDEPPSMGDVFESINNIGRLWQSSRESVREILNHFEKSK